MTSWITHKSFDILYVDYAAGKTEQELIESLYAIQPLLNSRSNRKIRVLIDITGSFTTPNFLLEAKKLETEFLYQFDTRRAIVGVSGLKRIVIDSFNMILRENQKLRPFDSRQEALDYLVQLDF